MALVKCITVPFIICSRTFSSGAVSVLPIRPEKIEYERQQAVNTLPLRPLRLLTCHTCKTSCQEPLCDLWKVLCSSSLATDRTPDNSGRTSGKDVMLMLQNATAELE